MNSSETLNQLYDTSKYLFHGSSNDQIKLLEPRKVRGHDDSSDKFKNNKAVFASIEPSAPILFSLVDWSKIPDELAKGVE